MAKAKKKQRQPNLPAVTNLRPQLDALLADAQRAEQDDADMLTRLDTISQRVRPPELLPVLLISYAEAPADGQARLASLIPGWLAQQNYLDTLQNLVLAGNLNDLQQETAMHWLEATGSDVSTIRAELEQSSFYQAYNFSNEMQGNLTIFFYTDRRRNRVQAFGFLLDFQPPWEGAIKDVTLYAKRPPEQGVEEFLGYWQEYMSSYMSDTGMEQISADEAKHIVITALQQNREQNIRLHGDLRPERDLFIRHILSLPDAEDTPAFSVEELDYLLEHGTASETLQREEQTMGYRVRGPDGTERRVVRIAGDTELI